MMEFSRLFGGYIDFPSETHVMGILAYERKHFRRREFTVLLEKRYHSPAEEFALKLRLGNRAFFLGLTLVPERPLWVRLAATLALLAYVLGKADLDLWGEHRYTGGNYDFYVHGPIPYKLVPHWEPSSRFLTLAYWGRYPKEDWNPKNFGERR